MPTKVRFLPEAPTARETMLFLQALKRYAVIGRKKKKQLEMIAGAFSDLCHPAMVSWDKVKSLLGWGLLAELGRRSTLLNELRKHSIALSTIYDTCSSSFYNSALLGFESIKGEGLVISRIREIGCVPAREYVDANARKRLALLKRQHSHDADYQPEIRFLSERLTTGGELPPAFGSYERLERLNNWDSPYSHVFKARHPVTERLGLLKVLREPYASDAAATKRFLRVPQALTRLPHPNIVALADEGGYQDGHTYYVTEYIDGITLTDALRSPSIPLVHRRAIAAALIEAVSYAHENNVVHRDLQPDNVLITGQFTPKITDFDLALTDSDRLITNTTLGSHPYMSPERRQDSRLCSKADDVFALGLLLGQLLAGALILEPDHLLSKLKEAGVSDNEYRTIALCVTAEESIRLPNGLAVRAAWHDVGHGPFSKLQVLPRPGARLDYRGKTNEKLDLSHLFVPKATFRGGTFAGSKLSYSVLSNATFIEAHFADSDFTGVVAVGARFQGATVEGATFAHANLERTVWDGVDLAGVDLRGANLWGAQLQLAINLPHAQLQGANFARNVLSSAQQRFLRSARARGIHQAGSYGDLLKLMTAEYGQELPEGLWWLERFAAQDGAQQLY